MNVLFFMRSTVYVRNFESTLRLLAERGHQVHVAAETHQSLDPTDLVGRLCRRYPHITHGAPPRAQAQQWSKLGIELRKTIDYLRYFEAEYRDAPKLRLRAEVLTPLFVTPRVCRRLARAGAGRWLLRRLLRWCDRAIPSDPAVSAFIRERRPDLVLVTPLVEPGSPQSEYLRSARALGIPTGLCVYSWDNLTSKGLIHDPVDVVTVWNQAMKDEAVGLHHVPAGRVAVTGAAAYDHWFTWEPRTSREAFCSRVGLDPQHSYLLYLCSSKFIAPNEVPFVRRWIHDVRAASPTLRSAGVLIRPHPQNMERWHTLDVSDLGNVTIWPRCDGNPTDRDTRADYYDSIAHSAAVVGINTSALIEGAIMGRGVYTLLAPEFRDTQEGTLHFRHLRDVNGGLLHVASNMTEHVSQLEAAIHDPEAAAGACRRFVEAFVRPHGIGEPATPRLVATLEATAASGFGRPDRGPWWAGLGRPALARVAVAVEKAIEREEEERLTAKRLVQAQRATRRLALAGPATVKGGSAQAFEHYLCVRDQLRALREAEARHNGLTPSERHELATLEPLWDAGEGTIATLRRFGEVIGGVRLAEYEAEERAVRVRLERDLRRLLARGDHALWVDEPFVLGAFGFNSGGKQYNEDTLRFFRVISLLQDAVLIKEFRGAVSRRTVWEVGGGWGGFAYHFKTLCPDVTYLITGRPDQFLLSAVYLMTLFPTARFRFYQPQDPDAFWRGWDCVDFAFAPESVVARMRLPSLDLTVDLMTLERMSGQRVGMHVQRAYDLGSRHFFSICPFGDSGGDTPPPVRPAIERLYWPHPVCAPESLAKRLSLSGADRTYFLGWKRLRV